MLRPAIRYKDILDKKFADELYTKDYYYYCGTGRDGCPPNIRCDDTIRQYAILDNDWDGGKKVVGYLAYGIDYATKSVYDFGLYSFEKGNTTVGKDVFQELERLINIFHRVEWKVVGDNPVKAKYDWFCSKHNGNCVCLHDYTIDEECNYQDIYIYEIINNNK